MNFYDMLDRLELLNGSLEKEYYLIHILKHVKRAEAFFRFAFNDQVFGVKEKTVLAAFDSPEHEYEHVSDWLATQPFEPFGDGKGSYTIPDLIIFGNTLLAKSGQDQISALNNFLRQCQPNKKKWFCRAILKDLRCGIKVKTINKVFKHLKLPIIEKFSMQLCDKIDLYDEAMVKKKLVFPCTMENKYDGIRIQAEVWPIEATDYVPQYAGLDLMGASMTSRRGNDRTHLYPEIIAELKKRFYGEHVILDCEVISRSFQSLMNKSDTSPKKLIIWDILNDEGLQYKDRWSNLFSLCQGLGITALQENPINNNISSILFIAEHFSCNSLKEAQDYYSYLNERGEEGIIIKLDSRPYERNSRKHMFKCKKVFTADLKCIGYKLGEGRRSGMVSTLELIDKSGTIQVDVGSGITDYNSEAMTAQVDVDNPWFVGTIIEIAYNEITETNSIRNPRFRAFRDDKEEADDLSQENVRQA